jgi:hypothetical protein
LFWAETSKKEEITKNNKDNPKYIKKTRVRLILLCANGSFSPQYKARW